MKSDKSSAYFKDMTRFIRLITVVGLLDLDAADSKHVGVVS
jgi:hypothetical protein